MNKYINKDSKKYVYDLVGVSQHFGISFGGHYTAFAKNNGEWYDFNDDSVRKIKEDVVVSDNAYLLFYELKKERE